MDKCSFTFLYIQIHHYREMKRNRMKLEYLVLTLQGNEKLCIDEEFAYIRLTLRRSSHARYQKGLRNRCHIDLNLK